MNRRTPKRPRPFEHLENRQLLAADVYYYVTDSGDVSNYDGSQLRVTNHDIVELTVNENGTYFHRIFFHGDSVGLDNPSSNTEAISAFAFDNDGSLLITTMGRADVGGIRSDAGDILKFRPTRLGSQTAGSWSRYFDASDVGFPELGGRESPFRIDALDVLDDGSLVMSLGGNPPRVGSVNLGGVTANNKDLLSFRFDVNSTPTNTRGRWSMYARDDQLQLTRTSGPTDENTTALWLDESVAGVPNILFSTADDFTIESSGGSGRREDVGILRRNSAQATARFGGLEVDGSRRGLGNDQITGFQKAQPRIRISDQQVVEGDAGTRMMTFQVTLSEPTSKTVSVRYTTLDGSATTANNDYQARTGTLSWGPGQSGVRQVRVPIQGDTVVEQQERFRVVLSNSQNATLVDGIGVGTIVDDDSGQVGRPALRISDVRQLEGDTGGKSFVFTVTPSSTPQAPMSVDFSTLNGTATIADRDYVSRTGTLSWPAQSTSPRRVYVWVRGDTNSGEGDESFTVRLFNPRNATIADGIGVGTIVDDDGDGPATDIPSVTIRDVRQIERDSGGASFVFDVQLSRSPTRPVTVNYATQDGTARVADQDYVARRGELSWPVGSTATRRIHVWVRGDTNQEPDENFWVRLSNPQHARLADGQATGTIVNDDGSSTAQPRLSVSDFSALEGHTGGANFVFTVSLSAAATRPISVQYATFDGTATQSDRDYVSTSGTLNWPAGTTAPRRIFVWVRGDRDVESTESFFVRLSNPQNATLADATGIGIIRTDDARAAVAAALEVADRVADNRLSDDTAVDHAGHPSDGFWEQLGRPLRETNLTVGD